MCYVAECVSTNLFNLLPLLMILECAFIFPWDAQYCLDQLFIRMLAVRYTDRETLNK